MVAALAILVTGALSIPVPPPSIDAAERPRPLRAIVAQPAYFVALFGAATGSGVMILAMTATPIAMVEHHHTLADAARVIQAHVLGMFIPSFFTGSLIARFGILPVMLAGVAVLGGHIAMTLSGTGFPSFLGALVFLGVGWNFLFVGGTTLLTQTYTAAERGRAQATNDLVIYAVGLLASLGAGAFLGRLGWQMLNLALLPWLAVAAGLILWLAMRRRTDAGRCHQDRHSCADGSGGFSRPTLGVHETPSPRCLASRPSRACRSGLPGMGSVWRSSQPLRPRRLP